MKSAWLGLAVMGALGSSGCGPLTPSSPATTPAPAAAPQVSTTHPSTTPPSTSPASTSPPDAVSPATSAQTVKLSAGVALPQSLPDGTVMTFSVDYRFRAEAPDAAAQYVWIIQVRHSRFRSRCRSPARYKRSAANCGRTTGRSRGVLWPWRLTGRGV